MASCALVPFFPPQEIGGVQYIDGGFSDFTGLKKALELKAKKIIVVDTGFDTIVPKSSMFDITRHSIQILDHLHDLLVDGGHTLNAWMAPLGRQVPPRVSPAQEPVEMIKDLDRMGVEHDPDGLNPDLHPEIADAFKQAFDL